MLSRPFFAFPVLFASIVACSSSSSSSPAASSLQINASDYNQTCTTDDDCVAIAAGPLCGECGPCPDAAISKSDANKEAADEAARFAECTASSSTAECGACSQVAVSCHAGTCVATGCGGVCDAGGHDAATD